MYLRSVRLPILAAIRGLNTNYRRSVFFKPQVRSLCLSKTLRIKNEENEAGSLKPLMDESKAMVVIFDKDGTLICCHALWSPWAVGTAKRISAASGLESSDITSRMFELLGFCAEKQEVKPGLLAEATMPEIKGKLIEMLVIHGMELQDAEMVVNSCWEDYTATADQLIPLDNLKSLFTTLKEYDIKIAVCTADSRAETNTALNDLGLTELIDIVVCGDDKGMQPKPSPHNAQHICKTLGVEASQAFMVGDTLADMGMGKSASLGGTIGVLSGCADESQLKPHADHLVPHVGHILPIVLRGRSKRIPSNGAHVRDYLHDKFGGKSDVTESEMVKQMAATPHEKWGKRKQTILHGNKTPFTTQKRTLTGMPPADFRATHVIVGAGSAGCVLANRLTEDSNNKVVLIEAGTRDDWWKWTIHMPAALIYNLRSETHNWYYYSEAQKNLNMRPIYFPRGKVWGGSSSLNAMAYVRGHPMDYDRWEKEGAHGWQYSACLPYFKKAQTHELGEDDFRGGNGPLHVSQGPCVNPLFQAWLEAGQQAGYGYSSDMNGYKQEGVAAMDRTIYKGKRESASQAYLWPVLNRPNLYVLSEHLVSKLLFDGKKVIGVQCRMPWSGDQEMEDKTNIYADSDVILSGGAINTPHILLSSGVGPADHLFAMTVPLQHELPGVGQNLQDHLELFVQHHCKKPITLYNKSTWKHPHNMIKAGLQWFLFKTGDAATSHFDAGGFVRSNDKVAHPDIQFHFLPAAVYDHGLRDCGGHGFQVHVSPMRPTSKGHLKLQSRDFRHPILIQPNYLETEQDRKEMRDCIKAARKIFKQNAFDELRGDEIQPGANMQSDSQLDEFVRANADTAYHPSCTCKMGDVTDQMAVVDPQTMKVHGLEGLRIVDASVMPSIVSGNLNAPTIMIAEKAADLIRGKTPLPAANVPIWKQEYKNIGTN